jgi:hypothetical protein
LVLAGLQAQVLLALGEVEQIQFFQLLHQQAVAAVAVVLLVVMD